MHTINTLLTDHFSLSIFKHKVIYLMLSAVSSLTVTLIRKIVAPSLLINHLQPKAIGNSVCSQFLQALFRPVTGGMLSLPPGHGTLEVHKVL